MSRKRLIAGITLGLTLIVMVFLFLGRNSGKTKITFTTAPGTAKIFINGKINSSGKSIHVSPGKYEIAAESNGFSSAKKQVEVKGEDLEVFFALTPLTPAAQDYAANNPEEFLDAEGSAGQTTRQEGEDFEANNPIIKLLPYHSLLLNIDYRISSSDTKKVALIIDAYDSQNRNYALSLIRSWGYEPSDYEVEFLNFINVLQGGNS